MKSFLHKCLNQVSLIVKVAMVAGNESESSFLTETELVAAVAKFGTVAGVLISACLLEDIKIQI